MTMAHWFEDLTKTLADEKIGRRTVLRRAAGGTVSIALASFFPGLALAHNKDNCLTGDCSYGFHPCAQNKNPNCFCWTERKHMSFCGCNACCSQAPACKQHSDCEAGFLCAYFTGCNCA